MQTLKSTRRNKKTEKQEETKTNEREAGADRRKDEGQLVFPVQTVGGGRLVSRVGCKTLKKSAGTRQPSDASHLRPKI